MSEEDYEDELVTSHSDENPELSQRETGEPLATYCNDGAPSDALYRKQKERQPWSYIPKDGEQVIDEDVYVPPSDD